MLYRTLAVGGVSVLVSAGLMASSPAGATPAATGSATIGASVTGSGHEVARSFTFLHPHSLRSESAAATTSFGAVTFVNELNSLPAPAYFTLQQGGGSQTAPLPLGPLEYTEPEILPAGTYTVEATFNDGESIDDGTMVVAAGQDSSELLYETSTSPANGALEQVVDPVTSVPTGQASVSIRNASSTAGTVSVSLDGKPLTTLADGGAITVQGVPAGVAAVEVTTAPDEGKAARVDAVGKVLFDGALPIGPDSFNSLYIVDLPGKASKTGVAVEPVTTTEGYQFVATDGGVFGFGGLPFEGSLGSTKLNAPIIGGAQSPYTSGTLLGGYYLAGSDGGVFDFGPAAPFEGSAGAVKLNAPIVGVSATVGTNGLPGYILVGSDGGVFTFNAPFEGSLGDVKLTSPVVGVAALPSIGGYVIVQADGSFTEFAPNTTPQTSPPLTLNKPIVGIAATPDGAGVWLVASDGGVFDFGDAGFYGSTGGIHLNQPVVGIVPAYDGLGYALVAADGGVFNFGNEKFFGSTGGIKLNAPVVAGIS